MLNIQDLSFNVQCKEPGKQQALIEHCTLYIVN